MYGLDPAISLDFLLGATLQQVCLGRHQVILNFDRDISISIESALAVTSEESSERFDELPASAETVVRLLDYTVSEASSAADGTLLLAFSNGTQLSVFDSSEHYESYQIRSGSRLIVV